MQDKKKDLPAMPFYIGDWKKDPAVQTLSREEKMIWFELIMLMWESGERGYLVVNGKPMTEKMIANALNLDNQHLSRLLTYFEEIGLYSRRATDKAIYSRKLVNIVDLSEKRKNAGKQGGNPYLVNQHLSKNGAEGYPNAETETESIDEVEILNEVETKSIAEKINFDFVLNLWNGFAEKNNLPEIKTMTKYRKDKILIRSKEKEFDLKTIFNEIRQSDFLLGKTKDFRITFDWIIKNSENYLKILEGNYQNGKQNQRSQQTGGTKYTGFDPDKYKRVAEALRQKQD